MAISRWLNTVSSFVLASLFAVPGAVAQGANKIGVASAVQNRVEGVIGGGTRALSTGSSVFAREVVRTGQDSTAQLLFLDETSLSIGPQSEVTLDRFVYDPNRGAGSVVVNVARGALRFASGSQQSSSYQIRTPVATIGVRGTLFDVYVALNSAGQWIMALVLVNGSLVAGGNILDKPGQALIFGPKGVQKVTWDSTLFAVVKKLPFPLFGNQWAAAPWVTDLPGNVIDNIDQLHGTGPVYDPYIGQ